MLDALRMADGGAWPSATETILDVGSGVGKVVLGFALATPVCLTW